MTVKYRRTSPKSIHETYEAFFHGLKSNSLEELVKIAEQVFGLPLVLHDDNSRLLYQYPQKLLGEKMWDVFLKEKTPGAEVLQEYQRKMLSDKPVDFAPFYYRPDDPEESSYILGQIYDGVKNYGYFTIFMFDNPLDGDDIPRAKIFSQALCFVMSHLNAANTTSLNTSLHDLLAENKGGALWLQAVENLENNTAGNYVMIVKPIGSNASQKTYAAMAIRRMCADIPVTIYHNCLVLLYGNIQSPNYEESERGAIADLENFLRPAGEGCGVSALFWELDDLMGYYQQGHMAALYGKEPLTFYETIVPAPIFQFASYHGMAGTFISPVLERIERYDGQNKTEYFQTLRRYSLLMHNKERAAAELCIHRNTLLYRLNRIEEIFDLPFEDPQTALHLLNSFQLWDVMKKG